MKKMIFVVRKAVEADIPKINEITKVVFKLYAENANIPGTIAALEENYDDIKRDINTKKVFAAFLNEELVGSVRIEVKPDKKAYLSRFGVKSEYQSNGVGKVLMNAVDNEMLNLGVENLYLHTASKMLSLVRFYYGRGFYIESTTKDPGYIRALLCKDYEVKEQSIADENLQAI